jgi:hypothetical protein
MVFQLFWVSKNEQFQNILTVFLAIFNFNNHTYYPFLGTVAPRGFSPFFFFSNRAQASKHSGTKTSSGFPPLADQ